MPHQDKAVPNYSASVQYVGSDDDPQRTHVGDTEKYSSSEEGGGRGSQASPTSPLPLLTSSALPAWSAVIHRPAEDSEPEDLPSTVDMEAIKGSPTTSMPAAKAPLTTIPWNSLGRVGWGGEGGGEGEEEEGRGGRELEGEEDDDDDEEDDEEEDDEDDDGEAGGEDDEDESVSESESDSDSMDGSGSDSEASGSSSCSWSDSDSDSGSSGPSSCSSQSDRSTLPSPTHAQTFSIRETNFDQGGLKLKIAALKISKPEAKPVDTGIKSPDSSEKSPKEVKPVKAAEKERVEVVQKKEPVVVSKPQKVPEKPIAPLVRRQEPVKRKVLVERVVEDKSSRLRTRRKEEVPERKKEGSAKAPPSTLNRGSGTGTWARRGADARGPTPAAPPSSVAYGCRGTPPHVRGNAVISADTDGEVAEISQLAEELGRMGGGREEDLPISEHLQVINQEDLAAILPDVTTTGTNDDGPPFDGFEDVGSESGRADTEEGAATRAVTCKGAGKGAAASEAEVADAEEGGEDGESGSDVELPERIVSEAIERINLYEEPLPSSERLRPEVEGFPYASEPVLRKRGVMTRRRHDTGGGGGGGGCGGGGGSGGGDGEELAEEEEVAGVRGKESAGRGGYSSTLLRRFVERTEILSRGHRSDSKTGGLNGRSDLPDSSRPRVHSPTVVESEGSEEVARVVEPKRGTLASTSPVVPSMRTRGRPPRLARGPVVDDAECVGLEVQGATRGCLMSGSIHGNMPELESYMRLDCSVSNVSPDSGIQSVAGSPPHPSCSPASDRPTHDSPAHPPISSPPPPGSSPASVRETSVLPHSSFPIIPAPVPVLPPGPVDQSPSDAASRIVHSSEPDTQSFLSEVRTLRSSDGSGTGLQQSKDCSPLDKAPCERLTSRQRRGPGRPRGRKSCFPSSSVEEKETCDSSVRTTDESLEHGIGLGSAQEGILSEKGSRRRQAVAVEDGPPPPSPVPIRRGPGRPKKAPPVLEPNLPLPEVTRREKSRSGRGNGVGRGIQRSSDVFLSQMCRDGVSRAQVIENVQAHGGSGVISRAPVREQRFAHVSRSRRGKSHVLIKPGPNERLVDTSSGVYVVGNRRSEQFSKVVGPSSKLSKTASDVGVARSDLVIPPSDNSVKCSNPIGVKRNRKLVRSRKIGRVKKVVQVERPLYKMGAGLQKKKSGRRKSFKVENLGMGEKVEKNSPKGFVEGGSKGTQQDMATKNPSIGGTKGKCDGPCETKKHPRPVSQSPGSSRSGSQKKHRVVLVSSSEKGVVSEVTCSSNNVDPGVIKDDSVKSQVPDKNSSSSVGHKHKRKKKKSRKQERPKRRSMTSADPSFIDNLDAVVRLLQQCTISRNVVPTPKPGEILLPSIFRVRRMAKKRKGSERSRTSDRESGTEGDGGKEKGKRRVKKSAVEVPKGRERAESNEQRLPLKKRHYHVSTTASQPVPSEAIMADSSSESSRMSGVMGKTVHVEKSSERVSSTPKSNEKSIATPKSAEKIVSTPKSTERVIVTPKSSERVSQAAARIADSKSKGSGDVHRNSIDEAIEACITRYASPGKSNNDGHVSKSGTCISNQAAVLQPNVASAHSSSIPVAATPKKRHRLEMQTSGCSNPKSPALPSVPLPLPSTHSPQPKRIPASRNRSSAPDSTATLSPTRNSPISAKVTVLSPTESTNTTGVPSNVSSSTSSEVANTSILKMPSGAEEIESSEKKETGERGEDGEDCLGKKKKKKIIRDVRVHVTKLTPSDIMKKVVSVVKKRVRRKKSINRTGFPVKRKKKRPREIQPLAVLSEEAVLPPSVKSSDVETKTDDGIIEESNSEIGLTELSAVPAQQTSTLGLDVSVRRDPSKVKSSKVFAEVSRTGEEGDKNFKDVIEEVERQEFKEESLEGGSKVSILVVCDKGKVPKRKRDCPDKESLRSIELNQFPLVAVKKLKKFKEEDERDYSDDNALPYEPLPSGDTGSGDESKSSTRKKQPRWRKKFLAAGLFSDFYKEDEPRRHNGDVSGSGKQRMAYRPEEHRHGLLPPPYHCGKWLRQRRLDFQLPYDLWWLHTHSQLPGRDIVPSWNYKKIRTNVYYDVKATYTYEAQACNCTYSQRQDQNCCGEDCINRMVYVECSPQLCPCKDLCSNQKIQKHEWSPGLEKFMTKDKGWGVRTKYAIKTGDFILEYVGEVVSEKEFKNRMASRYINDTHHYCLNLDGGLVIDGHRMGGDGRFVNHSCEPNCEMQKWSVNGLFRMALFALREIEPNEELTYDYNFSLFNPAEGQPCKCGSEKCRGVIGGKSQRLNGAGSIAAGVTSSSGGGGGSVNDEEGVEGKGMLGSKARRSARKSGRMRQKKGGEGSSGVRHANFMPVRPMSHQQRCFAQIHHCFLLRNLEKVKRMRERLKRANKKDQAPCGYTRPPPPNAKAADVFLTQLNALSTPRSMRTRRLAQAEDNPELTKTARLAYVFRDIYSIVIGAKDERSQLLAEPFVALPSKRKHPEYYVRVTDPIDLAMLERNIVTGFYKTVEAFDHDFTRLFTNNMRFFGRTSELGIAAARLLKVYNMAKSDFLSQLEDILGESPPASFIPDCDIGGEEEDVIRCICGLYKDEGMMIQCERCLVWQHCDCVAADEGVEHYLCEQCNPRPVDLEIKMTPQPDFQPSPGVIHYISLLRGNLQIRQGDAVYVLRDMISEEGDKTNPPVKHTYKTVKGIKVTDLDIFRVERLWKDKSGERFALGHHYLRPHETYHEPTRKFFPNEVMRVPLYEIVPLDLIMGHCWVLDPSTYCKGRPAGAPEEHIYICEYRVDKNARLFTKIAKPKYSICTKTYAFEKFDVRLKISRTYTPHGPVAPKSRGRSRSSAPDDDACSGKSDASRTNRRVLTSSIRTQPPQTELRDVRKEIPLARRVQQKERLNRILLRLLAQLPTKQPLDLSYLLEPGRRHRKKPALLNT